MTINGNDKKVRFKVEFEITSFVPPELDTDETQDWFCKFLSELSIDLPEDTPDQLYFMTRVMHAECTEWGEAKK